MPELRKDPIIGRWVIIADERAKRPTDFKRSQDLAKGPHGCPFCPGSEAMTPPEIEALRDAGTGANTPGWWVRVVPNRFPALRVEGELSRTGMGMYDRMNGIGAHEVIIETPDHSKDMADYNDAQVEKVLWVYRDRLLDLKKDVRLRYILIFKNHGAEAGASLEHPHSQLIATPIVPIRVASELHGAKTYYDYKERCVFCDIANEELVTQSRVVAENANFVAFCPFASRFPFEVWIMPRHHSHDFTNIGKNEALDMGRILKEVLLRLKKALDDPPYNYMLHTFPLQDTGQGQQVYFHWHLEIIPKLTHVAGFEWGSGFYINPVPPEDAAKFLKEIVV